MTELQYQAFFPVIIADLVNTISVNDQISYREAIDKLYNSKLYSYLEREKTKLWYYSSVTLYGMLKDEENGHLDLS